MVPEHKQTIDRRTYYRRPGVTLLTHESLSVQSSQKTAELEEEGQWNVCFHTTCKKRFFASQEWSSSLQSCWRFKFWEVTPCRLLNGYATLIMMVHTYSLQNVGNYTPDHTYPTRHNPSFFASKNIWRITLWDSCRKASIHLKCPCL